jgi:hypothetical protein
LVIWRHLFTQTFLPEIWFTHWIYLCMWLIWLRSFYYKKMKFILLPLAFSYHKFAFTVFQHIINYVAFWKSTSILCRFGSVQLIPCVLPQCSRCILDSKCFSSSVCCMFRIFKFTIVTMIKQK